jgi:hypothetical protein
LPISKVAQALFSLFITLPDLVRLGLSFMAWLDRVSGNDPQEYVVALGDAIGKLKKAETHEELINAAKALQDITRRG